MRVLVVEDELKMANLLKSGLGEEGHSVLVAHTAPDGLELAGACDCDVAVLDVMLPGFDGFELVRRMRKAGFRTPVLMLTARDATSDVVKGLSAGADDYLKKPFSFDELLARLLALSRRGPVTQGVRLRVEDLELDTSTHQVFRRHKPVNLTKKEYTLLEFLMRNRGRVLSRNAMIEAVWGYDGTVENNTLEAFIKLLRKKIDEGHPKKLIHTVRGFGYRLGA
ncbi:MAG TPA: response regulator transcription factor [Candidatus Angelobacter sp.]|jgi:DNA-binding response OmpR family regulator|nr:response regulator transcription factor [Candidatus Angelobacter sp.]